MFSIKGFYINWSPGIEGELLPTLKCYLRDRKQRVVLTGQNSDWKKINFGVPQGSVLGPFYYWHILMTYKTGLCQYVKSLLTILQSFQKSLIQEILKKI